MSKYKCIRVNYKTSDYDVDVMRGTKWGNKFITGVDGSRKTVIRRYKEDLERRIREGEITLEDLMKLKGKRIACGCRDDEDCHGDVIANIVNSLPDPINIFDIVEIE